tara:strand:+ start:39 stop:314 length:276 start_codon:yes stop_codon:yes gene_type:complete
VLFFSSLSIQYVLEFFLFLFIFRISLRNILKSSDVGVTTKKNTEAITIGDINLPRIIPNLYQILFNGFNIIELIIPKIKKIIEGINDQYLK